jgi:hypothetical protein
MKGKSFAFPLLAAAGWLTGCLPGGDTGGSGADAADQPDPDGSTPVADAAPGLPDANVSMPDAPPAMLHGTPPLSPKPVPTFSVVNRDGTMRTQADLIGHPTVIWFYPAAGTAG